MHMYITLENQLFKIDLHLGSFVYHYLRDRISSEGSEIFFLRTGVDFFK